jgi:hypothetical protein
MEAVDFRIEVGDRVAGGYRLTVRGEDDEFRGVAELDLDSDPDLRTKLSYLGYMLRSSSAPSRAVVSAEEQDVRFIGARLFRRLLVDEAMGMLTRARRVARESGRELRVTLRIRPPELAALPWEFMYDARPDRGEYLARQCLVVRDAEDAVPTPPLKVAGPLRMLAIVAEVADLARLDAAAERERLRAALAGLTGSGRMEIRWAEATKSSLVGALRQGPWHVFHYIGHGEYDTVSESGRLGFAGPTGTADFISAAQLATALGTHPTLRLAVLNACETGTGGADPYSSMAAAMIHGGLPAVVGMQYPITDLAAPVFSQAFYEALADGQSVDRCVQAGRMAIWLGNAASLEWGTPVLYQRSADGRVFDFVEGAETAAPAPEVMPPTEPEKTAPAAVMGQIVNPLKKLSLPDLRFTVGRGQLSGSGHARLDLAGDAKPTPDGEQSREKETAPQQLAAPSEPRLVRAVDIKIAVEAMAFKPDTSALVLAVSGGDALVASIKKSVPVQRLRSSNPFIFMAPATLVYFSLFGQSIQVVRRSLISAAVTEYAWDERTGQGTAENKDFRVVAGDGLFPLVVGDEGSGPQLELRVFGSKTVYRPGRGSALGDIRHAAQDNDHVAAVADDGRILLWRADGTFVRTVPGAVGPVALSSDGLKVIHCDPSAERVSFTEIATGTATSQWSVSSPVSWAYHRTHAFISRIAGTAYFIRFGTDDPVMTIPWPEEPEIPPAFSSSGRYLALPTSRTSVEIWDLEPDSPDSPGA